MSTKEKILQQYWGYSSFRGEQENIINAVLNKNDVLALLPTGGGKSICFQVPTMLMQGLCLVISPLVALMKDQVENLQAKKITATALYSGMNFFEVKQTLQKAVQGHYKFLYVSPERLNTNLFKEFLPHLNICLLAVDEAHCISQWGYDFRPPYLTIASVKDALNNIPTIALTASATNNVQLDVVEKLELKNVKIFKQSFERENLSYSVFKVESKINKAIEILNNVAGSSIIYCKSRKETKRIAELLVQQNIKADFYHAGLLQDERTTKQTNWINNIIRVMVCTNAFGMGIDKPDVTTVIHYNTAECLENYYQEAGRAGRNGNRAFAVLLYEAKDEDELKILPNKKFPSIQEIQKVYQAIADYLHIAVGAGIEMLYNFNLLEFCTNFKLDVQLVSTCLKVLEQEGHIVFNESTFLPSTVQFTADKFTLNQVETLYPELDDVMKTLLRTYEGIYDNKVSINEKLLAKLCKQSYQKMYSSLQALHIKRIINYTAQKETPQLYFLTNRASAKHISINHKNYFDRKQAYENKINEMLAYIQLQHKCRSQYLSNYFGDDTVKPCGSCDNCIALKTTQLTPQEFTIIEQKIFEVLQQKNYTTRQLFFLFKTYNKTKVKKVLEFLQAERKITVTNNDEIIVN